MHEQLHLWPEIAPKVKIGDIVTPNDDFYLSGRSGEVVEICHDGDVDGPIGVLFLNGSDLVGPYSLADGSDLVVRFLPEDLVRLDEWPVRELAGILFKSGFHHYYDPGPEYRKEVCQCPGCDKHALEMWTLVNYWGTVYPISYCSEHHKKYHGMCVESIEIKR